MSIFFPGLSVRVSALFAAHFFCAGLFLPFFPLVLEFRGLSPPEIGLIMGLGTFVRIASGPLFSNIADRTGQRRLSIFFYSLAATICLMIYFVPGGVIVLGVAVIGYMVFSSPVLPLSDAYALDAARTTGSDYARMRLWGSAGFVVANLIGGTMTAPETAWMVVALIGLFSVLTGGVVITLPKRQTADEDPESGQDAQAVPFKRIWFWPVLTLMGLFQASHAAFYGFGTIYWQALGVPDLSIGTLWALGVAAEIALFSIAGKLALRFDPPVFLIVAGLACVVRWSLFPMADTLPAMAVLQMLHGLTFGAAHLGSVAILARVVPARWAGTGQGLLGTSAGLQLAAGLSISGLLYETDPAMAFYLMAAVSLAGTAGTLALTPLIRRQMRGAALGS